MSKTRDSAHGYGPYLQKIPPLPVGKSAGQRAIASTNHFNTPGAPDPDFGWEFEHYFGRFRANCPESEVGANGIPYSEW